MLHQRLDVTCGSSGIGPIVVSGKFGFNQLVPHHMWEIIMIPLNECHKLTYIPELTPFVLFLIVDKLLEQVLKNEHGVLPLYGISEPDLSAPVQKELICVSFPCAQEGSE